MKFVIRGASIAALGILASLAVAGCDKDSTASSNRPLVAQYADAGGGSPSPMPGSPLGDAGFSPRPPVNPGSPTNPPGAPTNPPPGAPTNPGNPPPGSPPGNPGAPPMQPYGH